VSPLPDGEFPQAVKASAISAAAASSINVLIFLFCLIVAILISFLFFAYVLISSIYNQEFIICVLRKGNANVKSVLNMLAWTGKSHEKSFDCRA
jgi:hypothetical protein